MELKITTLIENMPGTDTELLYEHGLSLFIEIDGKKILFDTGKSGDFIKNTDRLNVKLGDADFFLISHGHADHGGGAIAALPYLKDGIKMYVGEEFFERKYIHEQDGSYRFIGNTFAESEIPTDRVELKKLSCDTTFLSEKVIVFKNFGCSNDFEGVDPKFTAERGEMIQDDFADEIALGLVTEKGLVVVAGCSHIGIINVLTAISKRIDMPIYAVLGGTHLVEADDARVAKTIAAFKDLNIEIIAVSHCTGTCINEIKDAFGDRFVLNNTGNIFEV